MADYFYFIKGLDSQDAIEFQEVFRYDHPEHGSKYCPFESFEDDYAQFPITILGELGSIFNYYGKTLRNNTNWEREIIDEIADTFIYMLIFAMSIRINTGDDSLLDFAHSEWTAKPKAIKDNDELYRTYEEAVCQIVRLRSPAECTKNNFALIFRNIKSIGYKITGSSWQQTIDLFHERALNLHLNFVHYSPDLWYLGNAYINHALLSEWLKRCRKEGKIDLPIDRIKTVERFAQLQKSQLNITAGPN